MIRLLGKASSINVRKVLWACDEIGVPYTREDWGSGFRATNAPEFLSLNPNGLIPIAIIGDVVLWESNSIVRYLASSNGRDDLLWRNNVTGDVIAWYMNGGAITGSNFIGNLSGDWVINPSG